MPDGVIHPVSVAFPPVPAKAPVDFIAAIIDALAPFGAQRLALEQVDEPIIKALIPVFGPFAVADAVLALAVIETAIAGCVHNYPDDDYSTAQNALQCAASALEEFIVTAEPASPLCSSARGRYAAGRWAQKLLNEDDDRLLREAVLNDIIALRDRIFHAQRFCGSDDLDPDIPPGTIAWLRDRQTKLSREIL